MPAIDTPRLWLPTPGVIGVGATTASFSAIGDYASNICQIPKTGNIIGLIFGTGTVGVGDTVTGTIETVTAAGIPSGTLYHANATATVAVANSDDNTNKTVTFTSFAVTKGDTVALKIAATTGVPTALQIRAFAPWYTSAAPYGYKVIATVGTFTAALYNIGFIYDDGNVALNGSLVYGNAVNLTMSSSTSPDEVGLLFTAPFTCRTDGFQFRPATAANVQATAVVLYDSSNSVLASASINTSLYLAGLNNQTVGRWATPVDLIKGRQYRIVLKPTTTTSWVGMTQQCSGIVAWPLTSAANPQYTSRVDGGAWTDVSTAIIPIGISVDKIYQPGGSYF